jgi:circadian clock protein KaiC
MSASTLLHDEAPGRDAPKGPPNGPMGDRPVAPRKVPTGIAGFDEITFGGVPAGRPTLVCGGAGSGKTLFALTFLLNGALRFGDRGVFMSFEERIDDLVANCASLGHDLDAMMASGSLAIDHVRIERSEIEEVGEYGLDGLFIRLGHAVDTIGATRVVLDTMESLFSGFSDMAMLRAEMRRLFGWIKDRGLTAIVTSERGQGQLTRHGLEEYVSDCVILLDNRVHDEIATRRLRIVKYRGSTHGTNEYPFLIDAEGVSVLPVTSHARDSPVSSEIVSSGIADIDDMLRNRGFFRGSSILLSGVAGTGKTTISSQFIDAACARGERCMFFLFEESSAAVCRNVRSVGIDLDRRVASGLLRFDEARPSLYGLEMHLARIYRDLDAFNPGVVVIDPISAFRGPNTEVHAALLRLVDLLKARGMTALFTSLRSSGAPAEGTEQGLTSLMDVWIELRDIEENGARNHVMHIVKARGTRHSNRVRAYRLTDAGVALVDADEGADGGPDDVPAGTARIAREARAQAAGQQRFLDTARRRREIARRRATLERQIAELRAALESEDEDDRALAEDGAGEAPVPHERGDVAGRRGAPT